MTQTIYGGRMNIFKRGVDALRQPDRNPRCYEMTEDERIAKLREQEVNEQQSTELKNELVN